MISDALSWWSRQMLDLVPARFTRADPSEAGALLVEPLSAAPGGVPGARLVRRTGGVETVLADLRLAPDPRDEAAVLDAPGLEPAALEAAALDAADPALPEPPLLEPPLLEPPLLDTRPAGILAEDRAAFAQAIDAAIDGARGQQRDLPVMLRLPATAALRRDVTLPLAAEAGLDRVLAYEMDRLTPFSAGEAFYAYSVLSRDRAAGRLSLRLSLVPRRPLQGLLDLLAECGAAARALEVAPFGARGEVAPSGARGETSPSGDTGGAALRIPLEHEAPASARRERLRLRAAAIACAALALAALVLPFVLQSIQSGRVERRIASLAPRVRMVQALQRRIAGGSAGAMLVQAERGRLGDAMGVMAALTGVLPDDTFLTDLTLNRGQLTISGQSPSAARLIPAISANPAFVAPAFSAPVTRIEGQDADLFSIRAGVAP